MKIVIGSDHRGFAHKEFIKHHPALAGHVVEWIDVGAHSDARSDFPEFAMKLCQTMRQKKAERGILICGSGIGMAIAVNRFKGIYAGVVWGDDVARFAAEHDKVNVLVIPSDFVTKEKSVSMITIWLSTKFLGGRYQERITEIDSLGGL